MELSFLAGMNVAPILSIFTILLYAAIFAGPVAMLWLGFWYLIRPAKDPTWIYGFKAFCGMGTAQAWRFTQRIAALVFLIVGGLLTVAMTVVCVLYRDQDLSYLASLSVNCLIWEVVLAAVAVILINMVVFVFFDRRGEPKN